MALVKCTECGNEISDKASMCPNCGCPVIIEKENASEEVKKYEQLQTQGNSKKKTKKKSGCALFFIIALAVFSVIFAAILTKDTEKLQTNSSTTDQNTTEENTTEESAMSKEDAENFDSTVWTNVMGTVDANNKLMSAMTDYGNGKLSGVDLYDYCKEVYDYLTSVSNAYGSNENEDANTYLETCNQFTIKVQLVAESLRTYVDSKSTSDLSKVNENIDQVNQAISVVGNNRVVFLQKMGFSEDEINQKISEIDEQMGEK